MIPSPRATAVRGRTSMALLVPLLLLPSLAGAQRAPAACPAADTLLGPPTEAQLKAKVSALYNGSDHTTRLITGQYVTGPFSAAVSVAGELPSTSPISGLIRVVLPYNLTDSKNARIFTMLAVVDDTVHLTLGPPNLRDWIGTERPGRLPVDFPATREDLLTLARARSVELYWLGKKFEASSNSLAALNALFRIVLCDHPRLDEDWRPVRHRGATP